MKTLKTFPSWLLRIGAIGLGFFAFVISAGVLMKWLSPRYLPALPLWTLPFLAFLPSLVAGYFAFKYSRRFLMRYVSRNAEPGNLGFAEGRTAQRKRIALAMLFSGIIFFLVFIFTFLSSIMSAYV